MTYENEKIVLKMCIAEVLLGGGTFCLAWKFPLWAPVFLAVLVLCTIAVICLGFWKIRNQINHTMELVDDTIDQLILHHECRYFDENADSLLGKFQSQIVKLHQILQSYEANEKRQREQMEQSISDLVHQINTPIANLQLYGEFLEQKGLPEQERILFAENIKSQSQKLKWMGEGFGKISRMEQGMIQIHPVFQPILPPLLSAIDEVTPKALKNQNEIQLRGDQHLKAWMDPKWTEEVFFNLLDNGTKYSEPGTQIVAAIEEYEMYVKISVTTQGNLPAREEIPQLFQRFYRSPSVHKADGVGLGLYLAREIVRRQCGYMKTTIGSDNTITFSVFLRKEDQAEKKGEDENGTYSADRG